MLSAFTLVCFFQRCGLKAGAGVVEFFSMMWAIWWKKSHVHHGEPSNALLASNCSTVQARRQHVERIGIVLLRRTMLVFSRADGFIFISVVGTAQRHRTLFFSGVLAPKDAFACKTLQPSAIPNWF